MMPLGPIPIWLKKHSRFHYAQAEIIGRSRQDRHRRVLLQLVGEGAVTATGANLNRKRSRLLELGRQNTLTEPSFDYSLTGAGEDGGKAFGNGSALDETRLIVTRR
jgi:hypothetical protein